MKLLMATCADESQQHAKHTLPIHRMYARRWGADFKVLDDQYYNKLGFAMWNYRTIVFRELLEEYERIFYLDSDIVINKTCPNIFDAVPYDTVGLVLEDKGSRLENRRRRIALVKAHFGGNDHWVTGFPNGGLYVVSKTHREIFTKINGQLWNGPGYDGNHYMYQIMKQAHKYVDLGYKWNHMSMFSEPWNGGLSRFDSYILHYAGGGKFPDRDNRSVPQMIEDDIRRIYGQLID